MRGTYPVGVIQMQHPTSARIDFLMALALRAHGQSRIHVDVMTGQVQADEPLENYTPSRPG